MRGVLNYSGVRESVNYYPIPSGIYTLRITNVVDKKPTAAGDDMVTVELAVQEGSYAGRKLFHNVTFLPRESKGAGITKKWLKVIDEPYDGDQIQYDTEKWFGKVIRAEVQLETYEWDGVKRSKNVIPPYVIEENAGTPEAAREEDVVPF